MISNNFALANNYFTMHQIIMINNNNIINEADELMCPANPLPVALQLNLVYTV